MRFVTIAICVRCTRETLPDLFVVRARFVNITKIEVSNCVSGTRVGPFLYGVTSHLLSCLICLCATLLPVINSVNLQHSSCEYGFSIRMENSVDPEAI